MKTVLITGGTQGLGAEFVKAFGAAGYNIAINARDQQAIDEKGEALLKELEGFGVKGKLYPADVTDFEEIGEMVKQVKADFGSIDVLVNNAGIIRDGLLPRMKEEDFVDVINTNLNSVFNLCRAVTPIMMKQRGGNIINISSVAGVYGNPGQTNYSASKAGMIGFTKSLAKELGGRNIFCNAIAPGLIESPMTDKLAEELREKILSAVALKRFGKAEDVAKTALFLAQTDYITGQVIIVDGGLSM